ncbi:lytic polysaccharide monooxygenase [Actinacidiphila glaucinigra]|uniref:lytic polysaccharide monooxygenase auxiliary activity family 9 protein n=1 Tax=Actinacidiphila glaucinigra TaxID=235986 RepID=UPI00339FB72B
MTVRRRAALAAVLGIGPLALTGLAAGPAGAHGTMGGPVSRVLTCYAENPENPASAACRAAVAAGGTQAFYDWNGVRIGDAAGRHRQLIPDGRLCSAGNEEFKALDLARADWPATRMAPGRQDLAYRVTARHKGSFELYMTKAGYDPSSPLTWSDLEARPFAKVTDPQVRDGSYVLPVDVPARSGRQLIYAIWQRSDSPEAFYSCSDVVFGADTGKAPEAPAAPATSGPATTGAPGTATTAPAPTASVPDDARIAAGADRSTVRHRHHAQTVAEGSASPLAEPSATAETSPSGADLAQTGSGSTGTTSLTAAGAAAVTLGASVLLLVARRRRAGNVG